MEKNKDYEKRLGRRLREAYLKDYKGPVMSRDEFHRLIEAVGKKKKHNRTLIGLAAACVALCLVCGGFMTAISMRESASAGKDDETKTVQQGSSVVVGSGVSEDDQNVGVSTKTYTDIEDIPEDLREQINFLDSDEFELEKVKVMKSYDAIIFTLDYNENGKSVVTIKQEKLENANTKVMNGDRDAFEYRGLKIFYKSFDESSAYSFIIGEDYFSISIPAESKIKKEVVIDDLL